MHAKNQSFTFAPDSRAMKLEGSYFNACKALCKVNNLHPLINYTPSDFHTKGPELFLEDFLKKCTKCLKVTFFRDTFGYIFHPFRFVDTKMQAQYANR